MDPAAAADGSAPKMDPAAAATHNACMHTWLDACSPPPTPRTPINAPFTRSRSAIGLNAACACAPGYPRSRSRAHAKLIARVLLHTRPRPCSLASKLKLEFGILAHLERPMLEPRRVNVRKLDADVLLGLGDLPVHIRELVMRLLKA